MAAAHLVLSDVFLLPHIARFQRGLPRDVVEWVRAHAASDEEASLPELVARYGALRMLQRLRALARDQPEYFDENAAADDSLWPSALRFGRVDVARWLDGEPHLARQLAPIGKSKVTAAALASGDAALVLWLCATHPTLVDRAALQCCVTWLAPRSGRIAVLAWLDKTGHETS